MRENGKYNVRDMYIYLWIREGCCIGQWICVAEGITKLKAKSVYVAALIKKRFYWSKRVPGDLIDTRFRDKEVNGVEMMEARTGYNKLFTIFCMKDPDYTTKIMASWMTLDKLEGAGTRRYFIDSSGTKDTKHFT